jgi:transcriptional regulator with XRE-family HTH domain
MATRPKRPSRRPPTDPIPPLLRALGREIQAARQAQGWTQAELATRSGLHYANVPKIEAGAHAPRWRSFYALSRALKLPMSTLLARAQATVTTE